MEGVGGEAQVEIVMVLLNLMISHGEHLTRGWAEISAAHESLSVRRSGGRTDPGSILQHHGIEGIGTENME